MPIQGVSGATNSVATQLFAAAASQATTNLAAAGDIVLQTTNNTPEVHAPSVGIAQHPQKFAGNLIDIRA